jgi:hypothetical protein
VIRTRPRRRARRLLAVAALLAAAVSPARAAVLRVPGDAPTIQAAVDAAESGDVVLIAPGEYREAVTVRGKALTLASRFLESQDEGDVRRTAVVGLDRDTSVITIARHEAAVTRVVGLTVRGGDVGIDVRDARVELVKNRLVGNRDGVGFMGAIGVVRDSVLKGNEDDGADSDGASDVVIEGNVIRENGQDGIEVRLHGYSGDPIAVVLRGNRIDGNGGDGVQLIDYPGRSNRTIRIERNVFDDNEGAAIGCLPDGKTLEDFEGAPLEEPVFALHNTFTKNGWGLIGGDDVVVLNNVFVRQREAALKRLGGRSVVAHNLFWKNRRDADGFELDRAAQRFASPRLTREHRPEPGGPLVDAAATSFVRDGVELLGAEPGSWTGAAPDLGAFELGPPAPSRP